MCVNFRSVKPQALAELFGAELPEDAPLWPEEVWQDYAAPIIRSDSDIRQITVGSYGMVPKRHIPAGVKKFTTMNARIEEIGMKRSYSKQWREGNLCLVPLQHFYEPNWETGQHVRWRIGLTGAKPFAVAGLWRNWKEEDGSVTTAFTQLTMNADDHPVMNRFHKEGQEKRSLIVIPEDEWDDWLHCRDPEVARSFARLLLAECYEVQPAPKTLPKVESLFEDV